MPTIQITRTSSSGTPEHTIALSIVAPYTDHIVIKWAALSCLSSTVSVHFRFDGGGSTSGAVSVTSGFSSGALTINDASSPAYCPGEVEVYATGIPCTLTGPFAIDLKFCVEYHPTGSGADPILLLA